MPPVPAFVLAVLLSAAPAGWFSVAARAGDDVDPRLLTVAEKSEYRATARHADVVELCERLAASSELARLTELGRSGEGRALPLLLISDPPVSTAAEARRLVRERGKLLVLAIGNIHGGEVCGKEALPMLAREILAHERHPLLEHLILAIAPIYNADGNERFGKDNRPGQNGPEEGMGRRENAAGLDLNRDFIKLDAPESRALVAFFNEWDPAVFIDTHTTNGSLHRYLLTYEGPKHPAGDMEILRYCRDRMMPEIRQRVRAAAGIETFVYGDFAEEHTRWVTYPAYPRFGTSYVGLRGRISILTEAYSYAPYRERVLATRDFVRGCLEYAAEHKEEIRGLIERADAAAVSAGRSPTQRDAVAIRSREVAAPQKVVVAGYVEHRGEDGRPVAGAPKDYELALWTHFEAVKTVRRPVAYIVPADQRVVIEKLEQHGIRVQRLERPAELDVTVYEVADIQVGRRPFQKRRMLTLTAAGRSERREFAAGSVVVPTAQPLGTLAVFLLEPESEDGLATWDLFGEALREGAEFPVVRVEKAQAGLSLETGAAAGASGSARP